MSGDPAGLAAEVNDAIFETWGRDAVYVHEASGVTLPCVVVTDSSDRNVNTRGASGVSAPIKQGHVFRLRASEVPKPEREAIITRTEDGAKFRIISSPKAENAEHSVFRFTVDPVRSVT